MGKAASFTPQKRSEHGTRHPKKSKVAPPTTESASDEATKKQALFEVDREYFEENTKNNTQSSKRVETPRPVKRKKPHVV